MNVRWRDSELEKKFQLALNTGTETPSHLFLEKRFQFDDRISAAFGAVLSSQNDIGAIFERQDFPLFSTGRFYRGELILDLNKVTVNLGRHLYDQDPMVQNSIWNRARLTGDGINWRWDFADHWRFENSIEFLSNEKDTLNQFFERILNNHSLQWEGGKWSIFAGEISIYTGTNQSINWRQSNPFLPYAFHYADSYDRTTPGYQGDNENAIVYAGLKYNFTEDLFYRTRLFVDDIQIDAADREIVADGYLWYNEFHFNVKGDFRSTVHFTLANPALGWHNGPYTDFITYGFELLPHSFGEIYSYGLKLSYKYKFFETYLNLSSTHKAVVDPDIRNLYLKSVQNALDKITVNQIEVKCGFYLLDNLALWGHVRLETDEKPVYNLILQTYF